MEQLGKARAALSGHERAGRGVFYGTSGGFPAPSVVVHQLPTRPRASTTCIHRSKNPGEPWSAGHRTHQAVHCSQDRRAGQPGCRHTPPSAAAASRPEPTPPSSLRKDICACVHPYPIVAPNLLSGGTKESGIFSSEIIGTCNRTNITTHNHIIAADRTRHGHSRSRPLCDARRGCWRRSSPCH